MKHQEGAKRSAKTDPTSVWVWVVARWICRAYFQLFHGIRFRGQQNIPANGPVLFAPNHLSAYDAAAVAAGAPRRIQTVAWDKLFTIPLLGKLLHSLGAFPVNPKLPGGGVIEKSASILRDGRALMIFPEGCRGMGRELVAFKSGVARIALQTGAPVLPVTIAGACEAWPRWRRFPCFRRPITITYHPPIKPPTHTPSSPDQSADIEAFNNNLARIISKTYQAYLRRQRQRGRSLPQPPPGYQLKNHSQRFAAPSAP